MIRARELDVVGDAARAFAERREIEPRRAVGFEPRRDRAVVDDEIDVAPRRAVRDAVEDRAHRALGFGARRRVVDRRLLQRAQAPVVRRFELDDRAVPFDQRDRGQESLALQTFLVEIRRLRVRRRHEHDAAREQRTQQIAENHRIADVADEELVEHEHARFARDARGDRLRADSRGLRACSATRARPA